MTSGKLWIENELRERFSFYSSITSFGLRKSILDTNNLCGIANQMEGCTRCVLHEARSKIVFGVGHPKAALMLIGEAPGQEEDQQGVPFVGPAGQLLTKIIKSIGLRRDQVYITNVVKCRPPRNRNPEDEEITKCQPFLERQVDSVQPKIICALGRVATQSLLSTDKGISSVRGKIFSYRGTKLVPTYHPAFLLRNTEKKRECWEDMKLIRRLLHEHSS